MYESVIFALTGLAAATALVVFFTGWAAVFWACVWVMDLLEEKFGDPDDIRPVDAVRWGVYLGAMFAYPLVVGIGATFVLSAAKGA